MATITVWLFIESERLSADQMSKQIGIRCDKSWNKGETRGKTGKVFSTNSWKLEGRVEVDEDALIIGNKVHACLADVLARIKSHTDSFRTVALGQTAGLYIGIRADAAPALEIKAETIRTIASLGVDLEIDLMV